MSQTIFQSRNLGNFNNQNCERNFAKITRFLPDEHSPPIHHIVRNSHRYLADWGCCSRATCPLLENVITPKSQQTTWRVLGGPAKRRIRREPLTLTAVTAIVLIGAASGVAGGAITSFAVSNTQQSKINDEIANLGKVVGELGAKDQNQWSGQNKINKEILKDRDQFVHRIEEALCSASATNTANERTLERSNLRLQYRQSLSAVVNSLSNHRITPEIISVRSLRKSLMINNSLYQHDILTAYSLGRIDHKIYRLNESLIFLVIFPTTLPIIY